METNTWLSDDPMRVVVQQANPMRRNGVSRNLASASSYVAFRSSPLRHRDPLGLFPDDADRAWNFVGLTWFPDQYWTTIMVGASNSETLGRGIGIAGGGIIFYDTQRWPDNRRLNCGELVDLSVTLAHEAMHVRMLNTVEALGVATMLVDVVITGQLIKLITEFTFAARNIFAGIALGFAVYMAVDVVTKYTVPGEHGDGVFHELAYGIEEEARERAFLRFCPQDDNIFACN